MCTPLLPKMHTPQPFVKRCYGRKRKRLRSDRFRSTAEPYIVKKYRKSLVNQGLCKKKLDTNQDTHCIKIGVQLWCGRRDSNPHTTEVTEPKGYVTLVKDFQSPPYHKGRASFQRFKRYSVMTGRTPAKS